ncbi:MAG: serine/threonine protein kinase [Planctomycetota bacterium]|nr:MAG: serine/threonine protein kinase [Planctomycetota bacterium]
MALHAKTCDPRRLDLFLHDRLPEDARHDLEAHLLMCPACRDRLDEMAGGTRWWDQVRKNLGGDGAAESWETASLDWPAPALSTDLDFLKPSDRPGSLGRLGPYEVLEVLGWGGMGVVLRAFDPPLHRPVAIKVLAGEYAASGTARKRFDREAQAAAAVAHEHVVPIHGVDAEATPPYLVMAFIPGQSLQQRLDRSGPLELKEILRIGMQTAAGLAAAHAQGLVHRDIKPANIMLENGIERVRITDFGLARAVDDASVTQNGALAGTPQYMAPEQARGEPVDQRADLFALGSTLYAMCTGRAPFRGDTSMAVVRQVSEVEPVPIRSLNADIPAWLEGIVRRLHAKDPAARFQSAAEVAELLERCLAHVQQPDRQALSRIAVELGRQVARLERPRSRRRDWMIVASLAAAVVASFIVALVPSLEALRQRGGDERRPLDAGLRPALAPESLVRLDAELNDGWSQVEMHLNQLQQAIAPDLPAEANSSEDALGSARRRAEMLEHNLSAPSEPGLDPVEAQMQSIHERLDALKKRMKPE